MDNLDLGGNSINDEAINNLTNALIKNTKLRELDLSSNSNATRTGWQSFSAVLQSPISALERLDLHSNYINDGTVIYLANLLASN